VAVPVDPAQIVGDGKLGGGGQVGQTHRRTGQPRAIVDQVVDIIEVVVGQPQRLAQGAQIGGLAIDQPLLHPLFEQGHRYVGEEVFVEQRDQTADFGAIGRRAVDHRVLVAGFFEVFADRPAVDEREAAAFVAQDGVRTAGFSFWNSSR
jgi:hypothetical protein